MEKINKKIIRISLIVLTVLLATAVVSATESNTTTDTSSNNLNDNNNHIETSNFTINEKTSNNTATTTQEIKTNSNNIETNKEIKNSTTNEVKTNSETNKDSSNLKNINNNELNSQQSTNNSKTNTINNSVTDSKTELKQSTSTATSYSDLKNKVEDSSYDEINLNSDTNYTATSTIMVNRTLAINGNGATINGDNLHSIFNVTIKGSLTLSNVTITNCQATYGGAIYSNGTLTVKNSIFENNSATKVGGVIYSSGKTITVTNCTFSNNTAESAGAIFKEYYNCTLTLTNSTFTNNQASKYGGAVYNLGGTSIIQYSTFQNNSAIEGGAIYNYDQGYMNIFNCQISNNYASDIGGAIQSRMFSFLTINNTMINNNTASYGGAIYTRYGHDNITNTTFTNNTALDGGAIFIDDYLNMTIINSSITNNIANNSSAAIFNNGNVTLINSNVTNNKALSKYGAIHNYRYGNLTVINSSISQNTGNIGGAIYNNRNGNVTITNSTLNLNSVSENGGAIYNEPYGIINITNSTLNINTAYSGGAIYNNNYGKINVTTSELLDNHKTSQGRAIYNNGTMIINITDVDETDIYNIGNITIITIKTKITLAINSTYVKLGDSIFISGTLMDENNMYLSQESLLLTIGNQKVSVNTNSYGNYYYQFTANSIGELNIVVTFNGNNTHQSSSNSTILNVHPSEKITTEITINQINDTILGNTITITGTLKDTNNNYISNTNISLIINGKKYSLKTNSNGIFSYNYTTTTTGTNNITATFEENDSYTSSTTTKTFTVYKSTNKTSTEISIYVSSTTIGNTVSINGILIDINGKSIPYTNITLTINGNKYYLTTDYIGMYYYNYTTTTAGTNNITASFEGNDNYTSSSSTKTFTVEKIETKIDVFSERDNITIGNTMKLFGNLYDKSGNYINATITLTINGNKIKMLATNGYYSYNYTTTTVGTNNVTVILEEDDTYTSSSASTTFNVIQSNNKTPTKITIKVSNTTLGNTITINGTLQDVYGNKIANSKVNISINGNESIYTTNNDGVFTLNYTTTKIGTNNITASYDGNSTYYSITINTTFEVVKEASKITLNPITTKNGYTVTLTAKVTDSNGDPVNIGQATFKLNGNTIKVNGKQIKVDVVNGLAQYNFTIPNYSAKDYNLTVVYGFLDVRLEENKTLTILKSDPELVLDSITSDGTTGHINGMLLDEHGVGVDRDTKVSVKINGKTILSTKIYKGAINLTFNTSTYKSGVHNLTVIFGENGCYNTVTFEGAIAQNVKDTIVVNPVTGKNGDVVSFRAYIIDESGNSVTSGSATFKLNGVTVKENGTQIKVNFVNGVAEYNFTIPDYSAKDYNLTAVASIGGTRYEAKSVLTIQKSDTHLDLSDMTISQGSNAILRGQILDEHDNLVTLDTKVAVKINGKTVVNTRVYDGLLNISLDTQDYSSGTYNVTVIAGENGRYNTSTDSTTLSIVS